MTKLLVAGGASDGSTFLTSVEVVNMDDSNPDVTCQNLPDLPASIFGAAGKSDFNFYQRTLAELPNYN